MVREVKRFQFQNLLVSIRSSVHLSPQAKQRISLCTERAIKALLLRKNPLKLNKTTRYVISIHCIGIGRIKKLNLKFRNKNKPTDVLTFNYWESPIPKILEDVYLGDIFLCPAMAKRQAKKFFNSYIQELERLNVHGLLHLFGYDHEKSHEKAKEMKKLENQILNRSCSLSR